MATDDQNPTPSNRPGDKELESAPGERPQRFIISHLLSAHAGAQRRAEALDRFNEKFATTFESAVTIVGEGGGGAGGGDEAECWAGGGAGGNASGKTAGSRRRIILCEADPAELAAKAGAMPADVVIEPERLRTPALAHPARMMSAIASATITPGTGATFTAVLRGEDGEPVVGAAVQMAFAARNAGGASAPIAAGGRTNADGVATVAYDPAALFPDSMMVSPVGGYWSMMVHQPVSGQTVTVPRLPRNGPFSWWHRLAGARAYAPNAGEGIKIGIIDTGVGPHPYLQHVTPLGAFLDGAFLAGPANGRDAQAHGTHVSGIIAARPADGSGDFAGIAPGAEVFMARVFTPTGGGNQGDIANAIDTLSGSHGVDLINMSLVGEESALERDAVIMALQAGTVCVCAAGNQNGGPVGFPATYPECVAVSALGLLGTMPANSIAAAFVPPQGDHYGYGGTFLPSFSNVGRQILCTAPGNGIVSTVPARAADDAPYLDMSGTSMASPLVTGALAVRLANDAVFQSYPRNVYRSCHVKRLLAQHAISLGLNPHYQGAGLVREG